MLGSTASIPWTSPITLVSKWRRTSAESQDSTSTCCQKAAFMIAMSISPSSSEMPAAAVNIASRSVTSTGTGSTVPPSSAAICSS